MPQESGADMQTDARNAPQPAAEATTGASVDAAVDAAVDAIAAAPADYALHVRVLHDLRQRLSVDAARRCCRDTAEAAVPGEQSALQHVLAVTLPPFSTEALYQRRFSLLSLAAPVFLGWLAGGLLSGLLNLVGMGGDILRPLGAFGLLWLAEYLAANPRARMVMLTLLGLGGLARFGAGLLSGMLSLGTWAGIRQAVFGNGALPSIFRRGYLLAGAALLFVFFSKKITALDLTAFRHSLHRQAGEHAALLDAVFAAFTGLAGERDALAAQLAASDEQQSCAGRRCSLARDLLPLLDGMPADMRALLLQRMRQAGFVVDEEAAEYLIWDSAQHEALYDTVGRVRNGDRCRILRRACIAGEEATGQTIMKGHVQRVDSA